MGVLSGVRGSFGNKMQEARLQSELSGLASQKDALFKELGQAVYRDGSSNSAILAAYAQQVQAISALEQQEAVVAGQLAALRQPSMSPVGGTLTCPTCGAVSPADSAFCTACGSSLAAPSLTRYCPNCKVSYGADTRFCGICGAPTEELAPVAGPPTGAPARVCAACGTPLEQDAAFCMNCGARVQAAPVQPVMVPGEAVPMAAPEPTVAPASVTMPEPGPLEAETSDDGFGIAFDAASAPVPEVFAGSEPEVGGVAEGIVDPEPIFVPAPVADPEPAPEPEPAVEPVPAPVAAPAAVCPSCGAPLLEGALFCAECGTRLDAVAPAPAAEPVPEPVAAPEPESAVCPSCGAPLLEGALFCAECGTRLDAVAPAVEPAPEPESAVCPSCGAPLLEGALFCAECGTRLDAAASASEPVPEPTPAVCPSCGAPLLEGALFCGECGARL